MKRRLACSAPSCWVRSQPTAAACDGACALRILQGLTNETVLDASLTRTFTLHFLVGRFDPLDQQPYTKIPLTELGSAAHSALSFDGALQGMVLLRNDDGLLPLKPGAGQKIAVIGPHGNSTGDLAGERALATTMLRMHAMRDVGSPTIDPPFAYDHARRQLF